MKMAAVYPKKLWFGIAKFRGIDFHSRRRRKKYYDDGAEQTGTADTQWLF
ncbi:MAG: hypothetical protein ABSE85_13345 [Candidatus Korobacteraceae bacterium]|jgi:hypothetical protein